jgi:clan AA aspartic protease (TIGR02281 family)
MIEIDPQDRLQHHIPQSRHVGAIITVILVGIVVLGAGILYWVFVSQKFAGIYARLNIAPLAITLELRPEFYRRLDQLKREPCDRKAILALAGLLTDAGYPSESAKSLLKFGEKCGTSTEILESAYASLDRVGEFNGAVAVANQLIKLDPAIPEYRFWRGESYEHLKNYKAALSDYISTLQLFANLSRVALSQFYEISRMYVAIGRPCDAITPLEMYLSFNVAKRQTAQIAELISEWAAQGNCRANHAAGRDKILLPPDNVVEVVVNGVAGHMLLDTGATIVSITPSFASRAKITPDEQNMMVLGVVGGAIQSAPGYATMIQVGKTRAANVPVAVLVGRDDAYSSGIDGLLGMTFLARFDFTIAGGTLELKPRTLNASK